MAEKSIKPKRYIRIGFVLPRFESEMAENTIYVSLRLRKRGLRIGARAVSKEEFNYKAKYGTMQRGSGRVASNERGITRYMDYEEFIQMLVKKNNGQIINRYIDDGAELARKIAGIEGILIGLD